VYQGENSLVNISSIYQNILISPYFFLANLFFQPVTKRVFYVHLNLACTLEAVCDYALGDKQKAIQEADKGRQLVPSPNSDAIYNQIINNQVTL